MRKTKSRILGWALLAGVVFITQGPTICRAVMAPGFELVAATCCDERDKAPPSEEKGASCPLHRLGALHLLPASERAADCAADLVPVPPSFFASNLGPGLPALYPQSIRLNGGGPFNSCRAPLYLQIASLRI